MQGSPIAALCTGRPLPHHMLDQQHATTIGMHKLKPAPSLHDSETYVLLLTFHTHHRLGHLLQAKPDIGGLELEFYIT